MNPTATPHREILNNLLSQIREIDFREKSGIDASEKLQRKHFLVHTIEEGIKAAKNNGWHLCRNNGQAFIYNGAYWKVIDREMLQDFFGRTAAALGVPKADARFYSFRRDLILQFDSDAILPAPEREEGKTLINLRNGTFEITEAGHQLRIPSPDDFITYQLPFEYDFSATSVKWQDFLDKVLPDKSLQKILQEYIAYVFVSSNKLKLEKVLLLYGGGANGKSVFIEVIAAMLGSENISRFGLESITDSKGYSRAELATKLLNLSTEISGRMDNGIFKQLASGESVEARQIYGRPFTMDQYGKLMFSTNELPREVEQTNGFFRRWLIVPFEITIPENEQDKELARKIIETELSGVFNWVLLGLKRLLAQRRFTESEAARQQTENYKRQTDNVLMFLDEEGYAVNVREYVQLKTLYAFYSTFCEDSGYRACSSGKFSERLRNAGYEVKRMAFGNVVYCKKENTFGLRKAG